MQSGNSSRFGANCSLNVITLILLTLHIYYFTYISANNQKSFYPVSAHSFFSLQVVHQVKMLKMHHFLKSEDQYLTLSSAQSLA